MSGPITWRNVEGPSFRDINQGMVNSAAMFTNAFSGLKDVLKERESTELANWEAMKERNTTDILTRAAAAATPEEAKALKAELLGRMQGMGVQVDSRAVLPVVQGMEAKLQDQAIKAMQHTTQTQQFNDSQDDRKTQDQAQTLRSIVAGAQDAGSLQAALNAGQAYVGNNMLTPRQMLQLSQEAAARDAVIAKRLEDERNGQAQRTHWTNQDLTAAERARVDAIQAAGQLIGNAATQTNRIAGETNDTVNKLEDRLAAVKKASPFGGGALGDTDNADFVKMGKSLGISEDAVVGFLADIKKNYPTGGIKQSGSNTSIPISKGLVEAALIRGADSWGLGIDAYKTRRLNQALSGLLADPSLVQQYDDYTSRTDEFTRQILEAKNNGRTATQNLNEQLKPYLAALTDGVAGAEKKSPSRAK